MVEYEEMMSLLLLGGFLHLQCRAKNVFSFYQLRGSISKKREEYGFRGRLLEMSLYFRGRRSLEGNLKRRRSLEAIKKRRLARCADEECLQGEKKTS